LARANRLRRGSKSNLGSHKAEAVKRENDTKIGDGEPRACALCRENAWIRCPALWRLPEGYADETELCEAFRTHRRFLGFLRDALGVSLDRTERCQLSAGALCGFGSGRELPSFSL
jgi:hypothetical protein